MPPDFIVSRLFRLSVSGQAAIEEPTPAATEMLNRRYQAVPQH
jgi:hypothetical protein